MRKIAILASIILLLALAACSEEPTPEPEPTPVPEVDQPTTAPRAEPTQAPVAEPTEEPVAEPTAEPAVEPPTATEPAAEPAAETAADPRLLGVQWHWEEFQDTAGINSFNVPDPNDYKIFFNADGTANIKADCNTVQATYETDGSSLSISMGPSTMAFCGEESLDQIYLAQLDQVVSYVIQDGILHLNLMADAGNMVFGRGPLTITPDQINLDTEALGTTWEAFTVAETPYDESTPPGPKGLPEHIEILFGGAAPESRFAPEAVMYIIPVNAYRAMWEEAGNESVSTSIDAVQQVAFTMVRPENGNLPALPAEEYWGPQDLAVQFARAVPADEVNETSATQTGYRFVGRWAQDANPVTNQNLRYVYQGFTNDGYYLVSFWYPTTSPEIPNDPSEVSAESMEQFNNDYSGYMAAETARLDALESSDWVPDLAVLDGVVASLQIEEMPSAGLQEKTWLWTEGPAQPGSSEIAEIEDPTLYQVNYGLDGIVNVIADCNLANFPYEVNWTGQQGGMLVQPGPVTLAQCAPGSYSDSFINSIQAAQDYRVLAGGDVLELILPAGGGVLTLVDLVGYASSVDPVEPEAGEPTATVTAPPGANVRTGPGTEYPIIGVAPFGATGRVVGVSEDGGWWAIFIPGAPDNQGWVSDSTVEVENVENVPVIPASTLPTEPTPQPLPTATLPPSSGISFEASKTTINAGETVLLTWNVEGVTAVYMFPVGANYQNYPTTGQGSKEVMPGITTTYVLLVFNLDGSSSSESIEITVVNGLTASQWTLLSYSSPETGYQTPIPGTQITARFEANGNLSGSAGCNDYSGGFTAYDETLQIGGLTSSRTACGDPPGIMEQESTYLSLLGRAARFTISAGQLSVFDSAGNRILVYNAG
jgi:heat shock protein HslJ